MKTKKTTERKCGCREPKRHVDCAYCGCGGDGIRVCGACREEGIDGPIIRGTERRTCREHKTEKGGN